MTSDERIEQVIYCLRADITGYRETCNDCSYVDYESDFPNCFEENLKLAATLLENNLLQV